MVNRRQCSFVCVSMIIDLVCWITMSMSVCACCVCVCVCVCVAYLSVRVLVCLCECVFLVASKWFLLLTIISI